jgi:hypothetical protein
MSSTLKRKAVYSSEVLSIYQAIWRHILMKTSIIITSARPHTSTNLLAQGMPQILDQNFISDLNFTASFVIEIVSTENFVLSLEQKIQKEHGRRAKGDLHSSVS